MPAQRLTAPADPYRQATILVIDDDVPTIDLLSVAFALEGYDVVSATGGREGLQRLLQHHPDLVVCDVLMPDLDGRAVARSMHAHRAFRDTPLVLVSACQTAHMNPSVECSAFVEKPFSLCALLDLVARLLSGAGRDSVPRVAQ
jgi:CheY-like chemotaxis protein